MINKIRKNKEKIIIILILILSHSLFFFSGYVVAELLDYQPIQIEQENNID